MALLQFQPLQSRVDVTFWGSLGDLKLHSLKLSEGPVPLRGAWTASNHADQPGFVSVSAASLPKDASGASALGAEAGEAVAVALPPLPRSGLGALGDLYVLNTVESIKHFDRKAAVQRVCDRVWAAIQSGEAARDPALLQPLILLVYCDLKHYKYRYWFSFPALKPPQPFTAMGPAISLQKALGESLAAAVAATCSDMTAAGAAGLGVPAWLVHVGGGGEVATAPLAEWGRMQQAAAAAAAGSGDSGGGGGRVLLAAADSSNLAGSPGWPLRNLLLMAAARWQCRTLRVLCLRERRGRVDPAASLCLDVELPALPPGFVPAPLGAWEHNEHGKLAARCADLAPSMDPHMLATSAVDLNLRLMRWRAAPALDIDAISAARCLLLGAGTLGCSVARTLLGWGVRHITLVDNSRVSYSNPVRQSLFTFEDCLAGGRPKAQAAAEALARIFPGVTAGGVQMSIPMPGHPIVDEEAEQVRRDIATLEGLVDAHDVVFLLMDTRESRWLPTLLCAARGRLAINAALGFDGLMVMRHGAPVPPDGHDVAAGGDDVTAGGGSVAAGGEGVAADAARTEAVAAEAVAAEAEAEAAEVEAAEAAEPEAAEPEAALAEAALAEAADAGAAVPSSAPAAGGSSSSAGTHTEPPPLGGVSTRVAAQAAALPAPARLGCYFCNDVVAPLNSTVDRTLDQQCTVARPGLSAIAGSLAVELMAAVLQHPAGAGAPAAGTAAAAAEAAAAQRDAAQQLPLGAPPHMVRGQLSGFSQLCLTGQAFRQCTACSEAVVREYRRRGHTFIMEGLRDPKQLEDLTGLTELHRTSEAALEAWGDSDDDDQDADGNADGDDRGGDGEEGRRGVGGGAAAGTGSAGAPAATQQRRRRVQQQQEEDWEEL